MDKIRSSPHFLPSWLKLSNDGYLISVHILPQKRVTELKGFYGGALKISLNAAPVDGRATEALIDFIAATLKIRIREVTIVQGLKGRNKSVLVQAAVELDTLLAAFSHKA